jgi:hypothetical protein
MFGGGLFSLKAVFLSLSLFISEHESSVHDPWVVGYFAQMTIAC